MAPISVSINVSSLNQITGCFLFIRELPITAQFFTNIHPFPIPNHRFISSEFPTIPQRVELEQSDYVEFHDDHLIELAKSSFWHCNTFLHLLILHDPIGILKSSETINLRWLEMRCLWSKEKRKRDFALAS